MKGSIRKAIAALFGLYAPDDMQVTSNEEMEKEYLFDFQNYNADTGYGVVRTGHADVPQPILAFGEQNTQTVPPEAKISVSPKSVLAELETIPNPITLAGLDGKIRMLRSKEGMIRQHYSKREVSALIERLENRRKYEEHRHFFGAFPNTADEKINALIEKHALVFRTADLFIPEFPDEAVKVMNEYTEHTVAVSGKKPVYYVIATEDNFRDVQKKRDPILLAQSPFGFYWQILGAWDEEMLLLSEL